jgi:hypothetical protein
MFEDINNNKYFWGLTLLMLNLGSKYLSADLGTFQETILNSDLVKRFILFSLFFVATKDLLTSLALTLVFSFLVYGFLDENSALSFVPHPRKREQRKQMYYANTRAAI